MQRIDSPRTDDAGIEQLIQTKGKTAARVTPADLAATIASEHYFTAADGMRGAALDELSRLNSPLPLQIAAGTMPLSDEHQPLALLTFCVLVLKNGFTVTGESACASPENFNAEIGRHVARQNAVQKLWPLLGYELKTKLSTGG